MIEFLAQPPGTSSSGRRSRRSASADSTGSLSSSSGLPSGTGVEYTIPITELVRGSGALNRGLAVEQLLDPELPVEAFEEMHVAYMRGLTKQKMRTKAQP